MIGLIHKTRNLRRRRGQGTAEYGLIIVLVGVFAVVALGTTGGEVSRMLQAVATSVHGVG